MGLYFLLINYYFEWEDFLLLLNDYFLEVNNSEFIYFFFKGKS